jgi:hypothetical protein
VVEAMSPDVTPAGTGWTGGLGLRELGGIAIRLFALCGLAVADPLFQIIRGGPTFLVAHGLDGSAAIVFTLVVLVVPPALLTGLVAVVGLVSAWVARCVAAALLGVLAAITVVSAVDRSQHLRTLVYLAVFVAVAAATSFVYLRFGAVRTFSAFLVLAPLLFGVSFLFFSPVSDVAFASDPSASGLATNGTPVVMVIFDEFPLSALERPDGSLNTDLYPNFGRLAATSTWYPQATSVAPWTNIATPAIDSGLLPDGTTVPTAGNVPRSVFTLAGQPGRVHATESETALCPSTLCVGTTSTDAARGTAMSDSLTVYLHQILPDALADRWLSPIDNGWAGFGGETELADRASADMSFSEWTEYIRSADPTGDPLVESERFVDSLREPFDDGPRAWSTAPVSATTWTAPSHSGSAFRCRRRTPTRCSVGFSIGSRRRGCSTTLFSS